MEFKKSGGNIYFLKTDESEDTKNYFRSTYEINSSPNKLVSLKIIPYKALGITSNNELLQWEIDKNIILKEKDKDKDSEASPNDATNQKNNFSFLSNKPISLFQETKFKSITLNKSVCIGLDINGNIMVWGQSTEGILGLGFDISNVETPTLLEDLKEINEISLSDHHAVAINSSGVAYSWGTGKFGELGLERSIYSPVPQQILTDTCYSKVFCGNLVTCFLDNEGHFYYFGVVIKQLSGAGSTLTIKSLLEEQIYNDGKILFLEKQVEELENEKFSNIVIGNGFIALLTYDGIIFTLEYNDKLTKLFSKYYLYNISVTDDKIFGLAKDQKNTNSKYNYYLFRWKSNYHSENDLYSDSWRTTVWKFTDDYNVMDNCKLLDTNLDKNIIFLKILDSSMNENFMEDEINLNSNRKKIFNDNYLEFESEYDDSYNLKYKRNQSNVLFQESVGKTCLLSGNNNFNSFFALNKNLSFSPNFNQNMNKTVMFQNKSSSPLMMNNKNIYIGNISERNKKKLSEKDKNSILKGKNIYNSNNVIASGKFGNINNRNSKSDVSDNINLYEIENSSISYNKSNKLRKRNNKKYNNMSENEKNDFNSDDNEYKEKELSKYRSEVDNIINNYKQKKKSYSFSIIGRGNKKDIMNNNSNNLNILEKVKDDNLSYDSNNNINSQNQRYSIPMSLSNKKKNIGNNLYKISYNDSSHILNNNDTPNNEKSLYMNSNNFSNNKTIKYKNKKIPNNDNKTQRNKGRNIESDEENESESENNNKNDGYRSKNSGFSIPPSKNKRKFKDKKLNNLVDQLSLIKEESENSIDLLKRKRIFSFDSNEKKKHMKGRDKANQNIKKNKSKKGNNNNYSDDDKSNNTDFEINPEKKMKRNLSESDLYNNIDTNNNDKNDAYYNNNNNNYNNKNGNKYKNKSKNYKNNNRQYYGENEDDNDNDDYNEK